MSIHKALFEVQREMEPIIKSARNPFFKSKYAELADFFRGITDPIILLYTLKNY